MHSQQGGLRTTTKQRLHPNHPSREGQRDQSHPGDRAVPSVPLHQQDQQDRANPPVPENRRHPVRLRC